MTNIDLRRAYLTFRKECGAFLDGFCEEMEGKVDDVAALRKYVEIAIDATWGQIMHHAMSGGTIDVSKEFASWVDHLADEYENERIAA